MRNYGLIKSMVALLAIPALFVSCSSNDETDKQYKTPRQMIELTESTRSVAKDLRDLYGRFTADMAKYVDHSSEIEDKNVVVSPLSAAMVFAMAANGVSENDRMEYEEYLGVKDVESLNDLCRVLIDRLPEADNTSRFSIANSVWVNSCTGLTLNKEYSATVSSKYDSEVIHKDFRNESATLEDLNSWCSSITENRIPGHFKKLDPSTLAILLNALYFKGRWSEEIFDASRTVADKFHGMGGGTEVMMMESDFYRGTYANDGDFDYFALYFGNEAFCLEIVLPGADNSNAEAFDGDRLTSLRRISYDTSVKAYMPKFSVNCESDLSEMLRYMGHGRLLRPNLTMFTTSVDGLVSYRQSASFSVDETGAEVAAVTSGDYVNTAPVLPKLDKVEIHVNRPFYFFISEFSTGACILSGRIADL